MNTMQRKITRIEAIIDILLRNNQFASQQVREMDRMERDRERMEYRRTRPQAELDENNAEAKRLGRESGRQAIIQAYEPLGQEALQQRLRRYNEQFAPRNGTASGTSMGGGSKYKNKNIKQGPNGGEYYIKGGRKVYIKKKRIK